MSLFNFLVQFFRILKSSLSNCKTFQTKKLKIILQPFEIQALNFKSLKDALELFKSNFLNS